VTAFDGAAIFAAGLALVVLAGIVLVIYNAVVALRLRVDKAWANIEVALTQRFDQIPALVDAVRDYLAYERETLERVTRARASWSPTQTVHDQAIASDATSAAVRSLFAVVENYPDLKSQANVLDLQDEIERLEGIIADRRELYNDQVYRYNARITTVPGLLLAPIFGWQPREFFATEPGEEVRPDASIVGP
jgi:LemA protein